MCSMCHHCGAEISNSNEVQKNVNPLKLGKQDPILSCKCYEVMDERENLSGDQRLSPFATPMLSPTTSISSSDRSSSTCSEISIEMSMHERYNNNNNNSNNRESGINSRHSNRNSRSNGQLPNLSLESSVNGCGGKSNARTENNLHENDDAESSNGSVDEDNESYQPFKDDADAEFWEPPEPEDPIGELECSVACNDDDDDEFGDGTQWGRPSSLSPGRGESIGGYRFKEEKDLAMEEVMNGKFKGLVCQLLKSVGISPYGEDGESWIDIVTSLSWEAASFLKPDAVVCHSMDPDGYVKVKCIPTGVRSQSQLVKGSVFKKHAAHKHMPTKYKSPKLLLIRGALGQSSSGLSSFSSMEQENDYLKSVVEMLDLCNPNVVLVEKSVSRDIQELILEKGITLVFDMKLHRLERVARCTGSPILSSDSLTSQKLKQCDSFYFEKFVEELASDSGKKPKKTLMFIEGCPTRLGCTILLKGAHSEELKRVKYVVHCAVLMAYHLILETSFVVDQRAMFSTMQSSGVSNATSTEAENMVSSDLDSETESPKVEIPICNGFHDPHFHNPLGEMESTNVDISISNGNHGEDLYNPNGVREGDSLFQEPYSPAIISKFSSISASLTKSIRDNFPIVSSYQRLSSYLPAYGGEPKCENTEALSASPSPKAPDHHLVEDKSDTEEDKPFNVEESQSSNELSEVSQELKKDSDNSEVQNENGVNPVLESQSILVLMSRRNALRGTICEQSHFSHIMFYKNFDVPLGKFLRENLLDKKTRCNTCSELPEAHLYYYAHHRKQLSIKVKRLSGERCLPGESDGKIWMWGRCGKCKHESGTAKPTKRVLISSPARGLSFGKFLELGFSHRSSSRKLSTCGHSLHRDFLYFFGFGDMVAMFKYSPAATYSVSLPPWKLPFSNSIKLDSLVKETQNVYMKGLLLFTEVENSLKKLKSKFEGLTINLQGHFLAFSEIEKMLKEEKSEFEGSFAKALSPSESSGQAVHRLLSLNRLRWELLLESCIWDRRLHSLLSPDATVVDSDAPKKDIQDQMNKEIDSISSEEGVVGNEVPSERSDVNGSEEADDFPIKDIPVEGPTEESNENELFGESTVSEGLEIPIDDDPEGSSGDDCGPLSNGSNHSDDERLESSSFNLKKNTSETSLFHNSENASGWFWAPFSEIKGIEMRDLQRLYFQKLETRNVYTRNNLPTAHQLISEEGQRLHISLGKENHIVSDYEGELSSIIACALALLKEGDNATKPIESLYSLTRFPTLISSNWSSSGSSDSESLHSMPSMPLEESRFSSFDGLSLLDSLVPPGTINPVVPLGFEKSLGKSRYTVICPYANRFRELRSWCCPSEADYISSLSRCMNWDAKGGKSKSFFAKTLDERLIIKEIKKTEFESFMKFADEYFKYMKQSYELGNQTCLAKVLGVYQVVVRHAKSGRESRHDVMVMENLTFGRSITRQYDLKGASHARYNTTTNEPGNVLLDQNFVNDMNTSPMYVSNSAKRHLERAIWNDTTFLNSINVMDYSLLVVVDTQRKELMCGIIDYLRQYTWDKHLETKIKSSLAPKNVLPTVIPPNDYKGRFRKFMAAHFLSVPDHWCSYKFSYQCDLCGTRE